MENCAGGMKRVFFADDRTASLREEQTCVVGLFVPKFPWFIINMQTGKSACCVLCFDIAMEYQGTDLKTGWQGV